MIVVEGPDGSGKTTLVNFLSDCLGLPVAPRVVSQNAEAMIDLVKWTESNVRVGWQPIIFDRHRLISELIYGPILRAKFEPGFSDPGWLHDMTTAFYRSKPMIIYCLPPFEVVRRNTESDPNNKVVHSPKTARQVWGGYLARTVVDRSLVPYTVLYDYTQENSVTSRETILHRASVFLAISRMPKEG